jgi:hypothetical protein
VPPQLDHLTRAQQTAAPGWTARWTEAGLRTGEADWATFEAAAERCYTYAGLPWPGRVVRVSSPVVGALAAPIADQLLTKRKPNVVRQVRRTLRRRVDAGTRAEVTDAVARAVGAPGSPGRPPAGDVAAEPLTDAERDSMDSLIAMFVIAGAIVGTVAFLLLGVPVWALLGGAVAGLVCFTIAGSFAVGALVGVRGDPTFEVDAIDYPGRGKLNRLTLIEVGEVARTQVDRRVFEPVDHAVRAAVGEAVIEAVDSTVLGIARASMISRVRPESRFLTGHWGVAHQARSSFYRDVCGLELPSEVWEREQAYAAAQTAVGWWWPHRGFVMVCDRPRVLHVQENDPTDPGNARLHCEDGPALVWADGWSLYYLRGVRVTRQIVLEPETLTAAQITRERNAEVRRIMMDRYGTEKYLREAMARQVHTDDFGTLWRLHHVGGEPMQLVQVVNSTPEPDGTYRDYFLRVPPDMRTAREAVAWTFQLPSDTYRPTRQT